MLETIAILLLILWLLGMVSSHTFGGFIHILLVIAVVVVLVRVIRGHFTADHHFAFEGAAWYWHFVDVVWLGLYVVVYWL